MTVSNVLNGRGRVGAEARRRVAEAVRILGYEPNLAARRLAGADIARAGLIYSGAESVFVEALIAAAAVSAAERGLHLLLRDVGTAREGGAEAAAAELVGAGAQGLLVLPPHAETLGSSPCEVPVVGIATGVPLPHASTIRIDNRAAARAITERLILAGRRRIAVLAGPTAHSDGAARLQGVHDALRAHGLPVAGAMHVAGDFTFASGLVGAEALLNTPDRPDAVVAANDEMAAAVLWQAHRRGVSVPDDLAVVGFDDTLLAARVWPPLTTVAQPLRLMACQALDHLSRLSRDPAASAASWDCVLPFAIVARASG